LLVCSSAFWSASNRPEFSLLSLYIIFNRSRMQ
jgi:hypothetical protein